MSYSFTEKKRIRKSFAKRERVQDVPYLLAMQLESYKAFLQMDVDPDARQNNGLQSTFNTLFPISSHSGNAKLDFVSYNLGNAVFDKSISCPCLYHYLDNRVIDSLSLSKGESVQITFFRIQSYILKIMRYQKWILYFFAECMFLVER